MISEANLKSAAEVDDYLEQHQKKELLRFVAVGSVDDGKSTLIGRLLHDTNGVYEDQLSAVKRASKQEGAEIDFSLFTDGLKAEREQGITIDVAYRYFTTVKRKFIIADTPGHIQYTRNMATGASTANVAIILIDARLGVLQQSRRHAYIASLLGIPHLAVAVNKMDLRGYSQAVFDEIVRDFTAFAKPLSFKDITFIPISALKGDNVVARSPELAWFKGPTVLEHLETVPIAHDNNIEDFRYPVQYVLRPNLDYRGFCGEVASGVVKKGDPVLVLPSRRRTKVKAIDVWNGEVEEARPPMSVTLRLEDEIDISRGDMLVHPDNVPNVDRTFYAMLVWLSEKNIDTEKSYLLKHTTTVVRADVTSIESMVDLETLQELPRTTLGLNDIGRVKMRAHRALYFDAYGKNRRTGSFILIDSLSNNTVAAGMILGAEPQLAGATEAGSPLGSSTLAKSHVSDAERRERLGQAGALIVISGEAPLATAFAYALERNLFDAQGVAAVFAAEASQCLVEKGTVLAGALARSGLFSIAVVPSVSAELRGALSKERALWVHVRAENAPQAEAFSDLSLALNEADLERHAAQVIAELGQRSWFQQH